MNSIGVDLRKKTITVCVMNEEHSVAALDVLRRERSLLDVCVEKCRRRELHPQPSSVVSVFQLADIDFVMQSER